MIDEEDRNRMTIGEFIRDEFLEDEEISVEELADETGIDEDTLNEVLYYGENLEPDDAYSLAEYFDLPEEFFLEKQVELNHDNEEDDYGNGDDFR